MEDSAQTLQEVATAILVIVKAMVDCPESVRLDIIPRASETLFRVRTSPKDTGMLIGKQGRTARALRIVLAAVGMRLKHPLVLDIVTARDE